MIWIFQVLFWGGLLALLHSYVIYPLLLTWLASTKNNNQVTHPLEGSDLPHVSVLISAFNEEQVIQQKIQSLLGLEYPTHKINYFIGSDASTDQTNDIITNLILGKTQFHFYPFEHRTGKPGVINRLSQYALQKKPVGLDHVFILTDANVLLAKDCIYQLVKHFKNPAISIVDAHMIHTGMADDSGISQSENQYISREVMIKHNEGKQWKKMIGPFGGCFAIRSDYYSPVPPEYLVDDFYLTMTAFEKGGQAISELKAHCFEPVSHEIAEEFKRKKRISAGNFQNMKRFRHLWWPLRSGLSYAFFSHKILRWLGPFFILFIWTGALGSFLLGFETFKWILALLTLGMIVIPFIDFLFAKLNVNLAILRSIRYFLLMNVALFLGFLKYVNGIKSNVWEPTKRNA